MAIQMTGEQFSQLLQAMAQGRIEEGSLADCSHTFDGTRDFHIVEDFITNVSTYITTKHISEANAVLGFGLLLKGNARRWWDGIRSSVSTWTQIVATLRNVFQPPQPNWLLINEIAKDRQVEQEATDAYVTRQMSRLTRLINFPMQEPQQLDMIYGHLRLKIKKAVPRDSINTIIELLTKARTTEQHEKEANSQGIKTKITCSFCKNHGHSEVECRRKKYSEEHKKNSPVNKKQPNKTAKDTTEGSSKAAFSCYGCGAPNVYRSSCSTCKKVAKPLPEHKEFYAIYQEIGTDLPTVASQIDGFNSLVYLDTCARASIASRELYLHLLQKEYPFEEIMATVTLADGSRKTRLTYRTTAAIKIGGRIQSIQLMVTPEATDNKTLLGADFIKQAGLIANLKQDAWCYADDLTKWFLFDYLQAGPNEITHTTRQQIEHEIVQPRLEKLSQRKRKKYLRKEYFTTDQSTKETNQEWINSTPITISTPKSKPNATVVTSTNQVWENISTQSTENILLEIQHLGQVLTALTN